MAYNPYDSASNILNLKGEWDAADEEKRKEIENKAKAHYKNLIDNGHGELANQLQNSNYQQAQGVVKGIGKSGKTAGRKYMTDILTNKYGMTQAQANNAITWDADSGDVSLGGINVGKGDVLIDGTNYYSDTAKLDNAIKKYVDNTGRTLSSELRYDTGKNDFENKMNQAWGMKIDDHSKFTANPFETETGKSILDYYAQAGEKAGYNQIATGAGTNGGNIDSYSQANAIRQNAALRSQGEMAAIQADNAMKEGLLNYYNMLSNDLGLIKDNNQQTFDNGETAMNNQMDRWATQSGITGYVPSELTYKDNPFFVNGSLANPDTNYQEIIDRQNTILKSSNDAEERAIAQETIRDATQARNYKILNIPGYGQYANTMRSVPAQKTQTARQADMADALARYGYDTERKIAETAANTTKYQTDSAERVQEGKNATDITTTQIAADSNEKIADKELEAVTHKNEAKEQQEQQKAQLERFDGVAENVNKIFSEERYDKGKGIPVILLNAGAYQINSNLDKVAWEPPIVKAVLQDTSLDPKEKLAFLDMLGIDDKVISDVRSYTGL